MKKNVKGNVAIITGAAGGIGGEIASLFDREGASLALVDINPAGLDSLADKISGKPLLIECDITEKGNVKKAVNQALSHFGRLDILVNNAGIIFPGPFAESDYGDIEKQVAINLMGSIYFTREVIPHMKENGGGNIVTVSSLAGIIPETNSAVYSATKFGLRGLNLTLALELKEHNIFVSTIFPDSVDTPMLKYEYDHGGSGLAFLGKPLTPETVAKAVLRAVNKNKLEICVPESQGFGSRLAAFFPGIIPRLWPMLEKQGEKNRGKMERQ